jgi:hypothetical protein
MRIRSSSVSASITVNLTAQPAQSRRSESFPHYQRAIELMAAIEMNQRDLAQLLQNSTARQVWSEFIAAGGNTADDLRQWITGAENRPGPNNAEPSSASRYS